MPASVSAQLPAPDQPPSTLQARPAKPIAAVTVLYDPRCPVCARARRWVERQRQITPIEFVPAGSFEAQQRFPDLDVGRTLSDITAVDNNGAVYRGDKAWLIVLWSIRRTRRLAIDVANNRRRLLFHSVVDATELMRRLSTSQTATTPHEVWAPPTTNGVVACERCR